MTRSLVIVAALAGAAQADEDHADSLAQGKAEESNLEANGPRQGVTFTAAFGPGLFIANHAQSNILAGTFRLGHVATPNTILTFELTGGTLTHSLANETLIDTSGSALIGAQYYVAPSVWLRGSVGATVHTVDNGPMGTHVATGPAVAGGAGIDIVRKHLWVYGIEIFTIASYNRDGAIFTGGLCLLALSHY
jgi:hypothetical protein